jgi:NAD(P)-dependent dehydrogenase (short-subunit alcohol dehydrogenase family)
MYSLKNKTIVINGGTKGIAKKLIIELLQHGANVVFTGRDKQAANHIVSKHDKNKKRLVFVELDLLEKPDYQSVFLTAESCYGSVNGFVNYSGITPVSSLLDCDQYTFDEIFNINIKAAFFMTQQAILSMQKSGGGSIVLVGSAHSWGGQKDRAPYAISKGALFTLFEHISHNYAVDQIRCNYITMGWTATEGEMGLRLKQGISFEELQQKAAEIIPMGRLLTPEDHIPAFLYLLSNESSMVTGSNIRVTAGEYI